MDTNNSPFFDSSAIHSLTTSLDSTALPKDLNVSKLQIDTNIVTLSSGSGGVYSAEFIQKVFSPFFENLMPFYGEDSGLFCLEMPKNIQEDTQDVQRNNIKNTAKNTETIGVTSTDSYSIYPLFFKGGDIGKLSICGSSNDVAMMGGEPLFINIGFIIEEGFEIPKLKKIIESISFECKKLGLKILSADTKVLPSFSNFSTSGIFDNHSNLDSKVNFNSNFYEYSDSKQNYKTTKDSKDSKDSKGSKDSKPDSYNNSKMLLINTTCIGRLLKKGISAKNLAHNDRIILTGGIGAHGARIFLEQNGIAMQSDIRSDCASLYPMIEPLLRSDIRINAMRDATRGGLSAVLNEWAISSKCCIEILQERVFIEREVLGVCEILGLEPYELANEGVCVIAVPSDVASDVLKILHKDKLGKNAEIIGVVRKDFGDFVESNEMQDFSDLNDSVGSSNFIESKPLDRIYFQKVILHTKYGTKRFLEYPQGEILPRIC